VCHLRIRDGSAEVRRGRAPDRPDLVITTDLDMFVAIGLGEVESRHAIDAGRVHVDGSRSAERHCTAIFGLARRR
jgi:putative sterol carrier protein